MFDDSYDVYEFDFANVIDHAELANLMAPRPFMVVRGHSDGGGIAEAAIRRPMIALGRFSTIEDWQSNKQRRHSSAWLETTRNGQTSKRQPKEK
jgi:hypothetical protein